MIRNAWLVLFCLLFFLTVANFAQSPSPTPTVRNGIQEMYEENLKAAKEYNCRKGMLLIDKENIARSLKGQGPVPGSNDALIAKATECIGIVGDSFSWLYRAKGYAYKGETKAALADFDKAITVAKIEQQPIVGVNEILRERAELYTNLGDRAKAEADLREALRIDPNYQRAKYELAHLDEKIAEVHRKASLANPQTADDYLIVGNDAYQKGKYDNALLAFGKSLELKPTSAGYLGKARALQALKMPEQSISELNSALRLAPNDAEVLTQRGYGYRDLKKWDEAIADYTAALPRTDADSRGYLLNSRGSAYSARSRYVEALKDHEAAITSAADSVYVKIDALTGKGVALQGQGKVNDAFAAYAAAVAAAGTDAFAKLGLIDTYLYRGKLYASLGKTAEAKADFNEIIRLAPKSAQNARAELAKLSGSSPAASKTAEQWARDAQNAAMAKKYDEAIRGFGECIKLAPTNPACYAYRGAVFGVKGDMAASDADFVKALSLNEKPAFVHFLHGQMYLQIGRKNEAIREFRTVLKLAPGNPQATNALKQLGEKP
ncbi:MAG: tetratricopeptide repeat protein [Pyrinomonadaceae bacterium]